MSEKPSVLVLGATGTLGKLVADKLQSSQEVNLTVCARDRDKVAALQKKYGRAVFLDLDDATSLKTALRGVDRVFMLTGYSFSMVIQSKVFIDAAHDAGVKHLVHLGVFTPEANCTDPHFAWHQMIEAYVQQRGMTWTFLHPNVFMQNLFTFSLVKDSTMTWFTGDKPCGWVALEDVAEVAAKILTDGEGEHASKNYWLSTESVNVHEITSTLTDVTGHVFTAIPKLPEDFLRGFDVPREEIDPYFLSIDEFLKQIVDGRMAYIGDVRDDCQTLLGRPGMSLRDWVELHKEGLMEAAIGGPGGRLVV